MSTPEVFSIEKAGDLPHEGEKYRIVLTNHDGIILKPFFTTQEGMFDAPFSRNLKISGFKTVLKATAISNSQKKELQFDGVAGFNSFCLEHGFWFVFFEVYDHNLIRK